MVCSAFSRSFTHVFHLKECPVTKLLPHISVPRSFLLPALVFLFVFASGSAIAEESVSTEEWDITADKITRYDKPMSIVAEGNIVLIKRRKLPPKPAAGVESVSSWSDLLGETPESAEVTPEDVPEAVEDVYETMVTIKADWVTYDIALSTIKARGNVLGVHR